MESLFALRFGMFPSTLSKVKFMCFNRHVETSHSERGDKKKAKKQLRVEPLSTTDDSRTFRFGLWLGLAVPAIAAGTYLCMDFS